jgi:bifunctional non-homologous end joining protein LigD
MARGTDRLPALIRPMLATLGPLPPPPGRDADWGFELKWDGVRAVAYVSGQSVRLMSRTDRDMTGSYPELAGLTAAVDRPVVLDGEIVAFDVGGRPSFSRLAHRIQAGQPGRSLLAAIPVHYLLFDVLHLGSTSLLGRTFLDRRAALEELEPTGRAWGLSPVWFGGGADVLQASRQQGLEGVVAKRLASTYRPGMRGRDWIKTKNLRVQEVVVGGWIPGQGRREGQIGSLMLGVPAPPGGDPLRTGGGLRYVGNVGTGFTAAVLADLARRLAPLAQASSPFTVGSPVPALVTRTARWVRPEIVGEVAYAELTSEGTMRHPSWRGYRPDKRPAEVRLE